MNRKTESLNHGQVVVHFLGWCAFLFPNFTEVRVGIFAMEQCFLALDRNRVFVHDFYLHNVLPVSLITLPRAVAKTNERKPL